VAGVGDLQPEKSFLAIDETQIEHGWDTSDESA
jgi:hypothetical protein